MNQIKIGNFIAKLRKEKGLTQEALAEKLGISNKSISKWECGKCLPDASLFIPLCKTLDISVNELLEGERISQSDNQTKMDKRLVEIVDNYEKLTKMKDIIIGFILILVGMVMHSFGLLQTNAASKVQEFFSGFASGVSIGIILIGVFWTVYGLVKKMK